MFARLHTLEANEEQYERGLELLRDVLLPWASESSGFCGLVGMVDRAAGKSYVLTLWADEDALERSAEAGDTLSLKAAEATGATRQSLESLEVTLFEVPRRVSPA